jgi:SSS family solute:Na+ symporter
MPIFDFLGFLSIMALFAIGSIWNSNKVSTANAYLLANRHTGLFALISTLVMTELNTSTLISFSSAGFFAGNWALTLPMVFLVGLTFYALTVAKKYREFNAMSVADVFLKTFGPSYARAVSICLILAMVGFSSTYVRSLTIFFTPLLRLDPWFLSLILVSAVVAFTLRGGLISIIQFDVLSFVLVLIFLPCIFYWTLTWNESLPVQAISFSEGRQLLPPNFVISLIILTSFTYILAPWYGQKIFSAKNSKTAYWAVAISAIFVFGLYGLMVLACSILQRKGVELKSAETALPFILSNIVPLGVRGISYAIIFSIGATTLAGVWSAMTAMVMNDFFITNRLGIKKPMAITLIFASISYILANVVVDNVFNKLILANIPVFALSFSLLAAFYWPKVSRAGAYASTTFGLLWGIFCYLYFGEAGGYTIYWAFVGLPLIFISGVVCSLLWPNERRVIEGQVA